MKKMIRVPVLSLLGGVLVGCPLAQAQSQAEDPYKTYHQRPLQDENSPRHLLEREDDQSSRSVEELDRRLSDLARDNAGQKRALVEEFKDKRQAMVGSPEWDNYRPSERRTKLKTIQDQFREREIKLQEDFKARRQDYLKDRNDLIKRGESR